MALKLVLLVAASALLAEAYPRYVAVPLRAAARSYPLYYSESRLRPVVAARRTLGPWSSSRRKSPSSGSWTRPAPTATSASSAATRRHDHVDYGAYTGGYGAFGWYSDHPVCVNCGYHH
ncbi:hypothetical protein C7M84_011557 [Penaeus vannamei]|uniref:Uncharacterized protein n=1 Tax=Penaeus vannamei TaxID=6689 RepID=A0A423T131_PENVA|nr:uncharacterized protein LOC113813751 [Penaeus vannamei]ROT70165.1 hypothetical protein C7M84_011557 [Penaeus vannamei]